MGENGGDIKIARPDGVLARGAYIESVWRDSSAADKELKVYPDNYAMLAEQWKIWFYTKRGQHTKRIEPALQKLLAVQGTSDEYWKALAIGYISLGNEPKSREALKRLMEEHPNSYHIRDALQMYGFIAKEQNLGDSLTRKDLRDAELKLVTQHPSASQGRKFLQYAAIWRDSTTPFGVLEAIAKAWMQQEPESPLPHWYFAQICCRRATNVAQAITSIERVMDAMALPAVCLRYSLSRKHEYHSVYRIAADLYAQQQRYGAALASIKASAEIAASMSEETVAIERLREGELWQKTGNLADAETAYILASLKGSRPAIDSLRSLYRAERGLEKGFEEYLQQRRVEATRMYKPAIPFAAKDLNGATYDLAALKGKVVVLNFWFVGCAPCREEMPALNRLVKHFNGKDVVFMSLALEGTKELQPFLKKNPFKYAVIPEARTIAEKYGIEGYPTHYIINKKGEVVSTLLGGNDKRDEQLRPIIEEALSMK
jgi:thiol-disulfide isomerase/thioredoxin